MSALTVFVVLTLLSALAWGYLLLAYGGFWRLREWLPAPQAKPPGGGAWPSVVALVPARDEAASIGATVRAILGQDYPGGVRLVVTDDQSSDGTAAEARAAAEAMGAGDRLTVVTGGARPPGWTGKLWALAQARTAAETGGEPPSPPIFYWLSDADIDHAPETLRRLVLKAEGEDRDLVSLMVRLDTEGGWARLLIPPFVFFFRMLYPFAWANDPRRTLAAAAGGCVLLRARALKRAGGFAAVAGEIIDDCALAARIKVAGRDGPGRIWLGQGDTSRSLRPYRDLGEIWRMVVRSAYAQLRFSPWRLVGTVLGMGVLYLVPPVAVLTWPWHGGGAAALLGAATWAVMALAVGPTLRHDGRARIWGLALPLAAAVYTVMTVESARAYHAGRGGVWKGRAQAPRPTSSSEDNAPAG